MSEQGKNSAWLRLEAEMAIHDRRKPILSGRELLALVECVEILRSIVIDMESGWIANHGAAAEKNYERLLERAKVHLAGVER